MTDSKKDEKSGEPPAATATQEKQKGGEPKQLQTAKSTKEKTDQNEKTDQKEKTDQTEPKKPVEKIHLQLRSRSLQRKEVQNTAQNNQLQPRASSNGPTRKVTCDANRYREGTDSDSNGKENKPPLPPVPIITVTDNDNDITMGYELGDTGIRIMGGLGFTDLCLLGLLSLG